MSSNTDIEELRKEVINICEKHRITESLNFTGINFEDEMTKFIKQKVIEARIDEHSVISDKMLSHELNMFSIGTRNRLKSRQDELQAQLNHNKKGDSDGNP